MRFITTWAIFFLIFLGLGCQESSAQGSGVHELRAKILDGDTAALRQLGKYFDSNKKIFDPLGHHFHESTEKLVALRIFLETVFVLPGELLADSTLTTKRFYSFLDKFRGKLLFSEPIGAFLITPFSQRTTTYKLQKLAPDRIAALQHKIQGNPFPAWVYENYIDYYFKMKDPYCLLLIASDFLKKRTLWNIYNFDDKQYIDLLSFLTHQQIAVPDEDGNFSFQYNYTETDTRMKLLIYFATHLGDYQWNEKEQFFSNSKEAGTDQPREHLLFENLKSENDSLAMSAFEELVNINPLKTESLVREFERASIDVNYTLPTFPYRFLRQLAYLTEFCRMNNIVYQPEAKLKILLDSLEKASGFKQTYQLENALIEIMQPGDLTKIEYWGLLHEMGPTHSIGRILDKSYSRHWKAIVSNDQWLALYLKKSSLFRGLGIIGTCNKYLRKFENASTTTITSLENLRDSSPDSAIRTEATKALAAAVFREKALPSLPSGESGKDYYIKAPEIQYRNLLRSGKKKEDLENEIEKLSGKINYGQIGKVISILESDSLLDTHSKYHFLESDLGFMLEDYLPQTIKIFIRDYQHFGEKELYLKNLRQNGIDLTDEAGHLKYTQVYEILKYDVVDGFVGGGGGRRDDNVYPVIRILELIHETRLGFPSRKCSWQGIWYCDCTDRAIYWRKYLEENKLVRPDPEEPVSISPNY
jgi:hypothetical protein